MYRSIRYRKGFRVHSPFYRFSPHHEGGVLTILAAAHAIRRKLFGRSETGPQAELDQLGCIDDRTAAERDEKIGARLARGCGAAGDHVAAGRVRGDGVEGSGAERTERGA